jgi:biopolymer transport protein ExbD
VGDEHAGRTIRCPGCEQVLCVPTPGTKRAARPESDVADADADAALDSDTRPHMVFQFIKGASGDDMDMTPMVDVTFLLLIFFMITAAYALQKSIEVPPKDDEEAAQTQVVEDVEEDSIVIHVESDNSYLVECPAWTEGKEVMSKQDMLESLRQARKDSGTGGGGPAKLLVLASGDAVHERVVAALDAGSAVGMEEVSLATIEDEDF